MLDRCVLTRTRLLPSVRSANSEADPFCASLISMSIA